MKTLEELSLLIQNSKIIGDPSTKIVSIEHDSRKVSQGSLFVCFEGVHFDAHQFINQAFDKGAVAILTTHSDVQVPDGMSILVVDDLLNATSIIVPYFYDYPSKRMRIIGITGTNGKTTTSYMVRSILINAGFHVGLIGTIQTMIDNEIFPVHNTTPNVIDLQHLFIQMLLRHIDYVVMEVSSHSLVENRVAGIEFDTVVFTNLTQDHLDFHGSMDNYLNAKCKLFDMVSRSGDKSNKNAIVNVDDPHSDKILSHSTCNHITYSINKSSDLQAQNIAVHSNGTSFNVNSKFGDMNFHLHITGIFNVYNILAAVGVALAEKIDPILVCNTLEHFKSVPGRFERVYADVPFTVIVDYAHTPDGIKNVLDTAKQIVSNRIITVFGCGGDRDKTKRPIMGKLAAQLSDVVIATSDNPRTEDPIQILNDIEVGIKESISDKNYECIPDRHSAITHAINIAQDGDIILILGKGHENYQILKDETIHFDDREVASQAINNRIKNS